MKQGLLLGLMSLKRLASLDSSREGKLLPHDLAQWGWRYIDEGKVERGAFDSSTMQLWWDKAQLPAELRVRYGGAGSFVRCPRRVRACALRVRAARRRRPPAHPSPRVSHSVHTYVRAASAYLHSFPSPSTPHSTGPAPRDAGCRGTQPANGNSLPRQPRGVHSEYCRRPQDARESGTDVIERESARAGERARAASKCRRLQINHSFFSQQYYVSYPEEGGGCVPCLVHFALYDCDPPSCEVASLCSLR